MHLHRRARGRRGTSAAAPSRASRLAVQVHVPLLLRRRAVRTGLHAPVAAGADQQEGRRDVAERLRRQRDPARPRAAAGEGRLHDRRPRRLHRRDQRLLVADRAVQDRTAARSSTRSRSRRTSPRSGGRRRSRGTSRRSRRSPRPACSRRRSRRSARSASTSPAAAYWTPTYPYTSSLTNVTSKQLGRRLQEGGRQAVEPAARPEPGAVRRGRRRAQGRAPTRRTRRRSPRRSARSSVETPVGLIAWGKGPNANVVATPIIGGQWVKPPSGKFPLDFVLCENSSDPNVPVAAQLQAVRMTASRPVATAPARTRHRACPRRLRTVQALR